MKYIVICMLAVILSACVHLPGEDAAATELASDEIDALIRHRVEAQRMATGVVVGVIRPKGVRYHSYGSTQGGGGRPVDENTIYEIGSLTKIFTALLLADGAGRGELSIDDPVGRYLPTGASAPRYEGDPIRLVDLATHTSGLPLRPPNLVSNDPENPYAGYTKARMYEALSGFSLNAKPGSAFQYSNLGYGLLGDAISKSAGKDYATLLHERILSPLNMDDTSLAPDPAKAVRSVQGYDAGLEPAPRWEFGALAPAGGLRSTASDLVGFLHYFVVPPTEEARAEIDRMFAVERTADYSNTHVVLGWRVTRDHGETMIWSNGNVGGFRAFMGFNRRTRIGVVALANAGTATGVDDIGFHILDPQSPVDMEVPKKRAAALLPPSDLERIVGSYMGEDDGDIIEFRRDGQKVYARFGGGEVEIFAEAPNAFFFKVVNAQLIFQFPENGGPARGFVLHQGDEEFRYNRNSE